MCAAAAWLALKTTSRPHVLRLRSAPCRTFLSDVSLEALNERCNFLNYFVLCFLSVLLFAGDVIPQSLYLVGITPCNRIIALLQPLHVYGQLLPDLFISKLPISCLSAHILRQHFHSVFHSLMELLAASVTYFSLLVQVYLQQLD